MYLSDDAIERAREHLGQPYLSADAVVDTLIEANEAALAEADEAAVSLSRVQSGTAYAGDETPGPLGRARFDELMAGPGRPGGTDEEYRAHVQRHRRPTGVRD